MQLCSLLIKFDRFGKIIWSKRIGLKKITFDKGFQYISPDNIFEINGSLFVSIISKLEDDRLIKLTPDGEFEWQKKLQINNSFFSGNFIKADNKIIVKGYCSNCFLDKNNSYRIVSLSQNGTIEWEKSLSGKNKEFHTYPCL